MLFGSQHSTVLHRWGCCITWSTALLTYVFSITCVSGACWQRCYGSPLLRQAFLPFLQGPLLQVLIQDKTSCLFLLLNCSHSRFGISSVHPWWGASSSEESVCLHVRRHIAVWLPKVQPRSPYANWRDNSCWLDCGLNSLVHWALKDLSTLRAEIQSWGAKVGWTPVYTALCLSV